MTFYASHLNQPLRSRHSPDFDLSPASSPGAVTPPGGPASPSSSTFLSSSVSSLWGGLVRRFSGEPSTSTRIPPNLPHANTFQPDGHGKERHGGYGNGLDGVYTPPHVLQTHRTASPMPPPPLEPLQLVGFSEETRHDARLLTNPIAEEIRIMVPARLGIVDEWRLVYSLEQDGASLATLFEKCAKYQGKRVGFVLCVKDCEGGLFGAYLSDPPHPAPKYFGTGECFLWRASVLSPLPPPPSAIDDHPTTNTRTTTIPAEQSSSRSSTPQSIRFKAFPYSGINEYYMLCEPHFLSLGAGDGKYGLWLDDSLERGVSSTSQTFGNEPLSDEGEKFGVLGVEVWVIGA
ncbi:TLD-domain-containing protein [Achaetomium macrosporum]|uniref:Oxidation resistance protein 1 n=1 Tax=Achaetomium macrosporum TaxID=79813 RepID=A0AAN7C7M0_9PEZI|nr:TLD-domain-containing protein [Achaetomium macrosporum]